MSGSAGIALLFSRIASSYDPLNRLFSLASDVRWRRILSRLARTVPEARVLDVCTGTADLAIELLRSGAARRVTAVDLSEGMLAVGRAKLRRPSRMSAYPSWSVLRTWAACHLSSRFRATSRP